MASSDNEFLALDPEQLLLRDRPALLRAQRRPPGAKHHAALLARLRASRERAVDRAGLSLDTTLEPDLPITSRADEITKALAEHQVVVVCGATGSGKTTQLPKMCLAAGRGVFGSIAHTQPRRLAARAVAERVASETGTALGDGVGFQVRFDDQVSARSRVIVMTDGLLLQQLKRDPDLLRYDTVILDEAHERSLNIDFLLGVLRRLLARRPELRLIVTSATIDPQRFSRYFDGAPIIEVGGRSFPIEMRYAGDDGAPLDRRVSDAVGRLLSEKGRGDVLVFLPGERDIRDTERALRGAINQDVDVLPLYARLSAVRQQWVFRPGAKRRVVLATNVAETSLTVPRIRFVVDSGLARIGRYSHRSKMQRLPVEPVSIASLDQRAGRCGRLGPGICVRLFEESSLEEREPFEAPQIQRSNLAGVILQMASLGLGRIELFAFMDPPDERLVRDGYHLLRELGALDADERITSIGRGMAGLPLEPRLARALLAAQRFQCLSEALVVISALAVPDMLERNDGERPRFVDRRSDWTTRLNLWHELTDVGGSGKQKTWCRDHGVNFVRVLEWRDVHRQLKQVCRERKMTLNERPAKLSALHRALLTGFVSQIGERDEGRRFRGARGRQFLIFPGSPVAASPPPWLVATELIETSRVYAHHVAAVTPAWIVEAAGHLVRREPLDPKWSQRPGRATARVRAVVFGLSIELPKRVPLAPMDPAGARALAIEHLLVNPQADEALDALAFARHNRRRIAAARDMEQRTRRLLVDDASIFRFFDARIPATVVDRRSLLAWHGNASAGEREALHLGWDDVGLDGPPDHRAFPDRFAVGRNELDLTYRFAPGEHDDGATLHLPDALLDQIDSGQLRWLVPGWLEEKALRLLRGLPKSQRKRLAPMQSCAAAFVEHSGVLDGVPQSDLFDALAHFVSARLGEPVTASAFVGMALGPHLCVRLEITDARGQRTRSTRDPDALLHGTKRRAQPIAAQREWHRDEITRWDMGALPEEVRVKTGGMELVGRPVLEARGTAVGLRVFADVAHADRVHSGGVARLVLRQLKDKRRYLQKQLADVNELSLLFGTLGAPDTLFDDLSLCAVRRLAPMPLHEVRDDEAFDATLASARAGIIADAEALAADARCVLAQRRDVLARLDARLARSHGPVVNDVRAHVARLVPPTFLRDTPLEWLPHLPRFLKAVHQRLDRLVQRGNESPALLAEILRRESKFASVADEAHQARLETYRWLLEEYRVSLFSQPMRTSRPVSAKRLDAAWDAARRD